MMKSFQDLELVQKILSTSLIKIVKKTPSSKIFKDNIISLFPTIHTQNHFSINKGFKIFSRMAMDIKIHIT